MNKHKSPSLIFTGGHHTSALAVAKVLKNQDWNIFWIGHRHSLWQDKADSAEYKEVTQSNITFFELNAGKIYRTYHPLKLLRLPLGFIQAFLIILRLRLSSEIKGIVTFGGYLGVPVVFCGWLFGIPTIAHEQTLSTGWANKFISLFARKIAVSWQESAKFYPQGKVVFTGLPIREEIFIARNKKSNQHKHLRRIYVTGGKQGSHVINNVVFSTLPNLLKSYSIIHQTGSSTVYGDYQKALAIRSILPKNLQKKYLVYDYINSDQVAKILSSSEIVISRSGAHIIHELSLFSTKCVLIPIPWSSHSEQQKNAQFLSSHHQAIILPESELAPESLIMAINQAKNLQPEPVSLPENGLTNMVQLITQEFKKT